MKFRKRPVEINAVQWTGANWEEINNFTGGMAYLRLNNATNVWDLYIKTLEGDMRALEGDWIIRGVNGEYYACREDIFYKTYDGPFQ